MAIDEDARRACANCIGETFLAEKVRTNGAEAECSYCGRAGPTFSITELAEEVERAFEVHYSITASQPDSYQSMMMNDREESYTWYREGEETAVAIMNAMDVSEDLANDVQAELEDRNGDFDSSAAGIETAYSSDAHYEEIMPSSDVWESGWRDFVKSIASEVRFFSQTATRQLGALFDDLDTMRTRSGRKIIVEAGPGTELTSVFRARVFQSPLKLQAALIRPDLELSAPPADVATGGRMNARGISTFYGATTPQIALAEVRPPVGSEVAIAQFELTRKLRLLDLNALNEMHVTGSIFDPDFAVRLGRMNFLRRLSARLSRPVMPDDQEKEYMPTQAVADYLSSAGKVELDGIMFPSVQAGGDGLNVVLFRKASSCAALEIPPGTEFSVDNARQYAEGWEREYSVTERRPRPVVPKRAHDSDFDYMSYKPLDLTDLVDVDDRVPALKVLADSITVHVVDSVRFETTAYSVNRRISEQTEDLQF